MKNKIYNIVLLTTALFFSICSTILAHNLVQAKTVEVPKG